MDLPWLLREQAEVHGEKEFLIWEPFEGDRKHWTYAETNRDIALLAAGLVSRGVTSGDTVLIHVDNSPESIFLWLACSMLGAIAVTTNPRCSGKELAYFAEKTRAVGIVTQPEFETLLKAHLPSIAWSVVVEPGESIGLMGSDHPLPNKPTEPAAPFCVQFTSGTTARPKAVVWTHANALWGAMISARHLGLRPDDTTLVHGPLCHTVGQAWQVLATLWAGGRVVVQPKFSASRFWDVIVRNRCTWTMGGPFVVLALGDTPVPKAHKLRFVINIVQQKQADEPWGLRTFSAHGMTELIAQSVHSDPLGPVEDGSIGRPAAEYELTIVDPEDKPVALGKPGELLVKGVRGLSIFAEYLDDAKATSDSFTTEGFFRTGDLVSMRKDGTIVFVDRLKDMLKVGGENVSASEIEAVARRVPGVREVAVVAQPHPMLQEVPFAFVIPQPDAPPDLAEQLVAACEQALADFKVPRGVSLVSDFPRSTGGAKVVKAKLRQVLRDDAII